jgi:hypothetical protein
LNWLLSLASAAVSAAACLLGVAIALSAFEAGELWPAAFYAAIIFSYGATVLLLLSFAWYRPRPFQVAAAAWAGIVLVSTFFIASLDVAFISGLEWGSQFAAAMAAFLAFTTVRRLQLRQAKE